MFGHKGLAMTLFKYTVQHYFNTRFITWLFIYLLKYSTQNP